MAGRLAGLPAGRRGALFGIVAAVLAMHGCVATTVGDRLGDFAAEKDGPARMEVAYVRELAPEVPPADAPAPAAPAPPPPAAESPLAPHVPVAAASSPAAAAEAASQPMADAPPAAVAELPVAPEPALPARPAVAAAPPEQAPMPLAAASAPEPPAAAATVAAASSPPPPVPVDPAPAPSSPPSPAVAAASVPAPSGAASAAAAAPAATRAVAGTGTGPPFEWPPSTRLSYKLTGYYRGDIAGDAQVEWVRAGTRYQVHLDITIGPPFAPLITRKMTSDGEITAEGLAPRRYDEDTKIVLRERTRRTVVFDADGVVLSTGERRERQPATQDSVSQFVQLSYLFTVRPELLRAGNSVDVPLALPRRMDRWTYDVLEAETLATPFGDLATFHLKPRREVPRAGGDLVAEIWYAPSLRYLPVRIRLRQDAETYLDMVISRKPEIAGS